MRRPARLVGGVLVAVAIWAAGPPALAAAPLAHREVLPTGTVLLVAERPALPIVVVTVWLHAGSALDPPGAPGLANLTAALLTRGTARRTGPELDRAIESVGGSLEADAGKDGVSVSLAVLRKHLDLGLDLLAEVLLTPTFREDELDRTRREIAAELERAEQNPETLASWALSEMLFPGHPYGHAVAGTVESVTRITRDQILAFHREHYRPDDTVIAVAGDVTRDEVRRALLARLGSWSRPAGPPAAVATAAARPPTVASTLTRELTQATVLLGGPAVRQGHPDYFALLVASQLLGGGSSSRLYTALREDRGLVYSISSGLSPGRYGASIVVALQSRNEAVDEAVRLVREQMDRLRARPVGDDELDLARSYLIGSFPLRLDTTGKVARFLIAVEDAGLGLGYPELFRQRVAQVTAADVARVAARYLDPAGFSTVVVRGVGAGR